MTAVLLPAFLALVIMKYVQYRVLAMPNVAVLSTKKGINMIGKAKHMFTSVLETIHGLGVTSWVSYLLPKMTLNITSNYTGQNTRCARIFR